MHERALIDDSDIAYRPLREAASDTPPATFCSSIARFFHRGAWGLGYRRLTMLFAA